LPTPDDIAKLLARVALRDRQAFDLLYQHTSAKLFGVSLRLLKDRSEAEEALQEIYIKIWQRADRYGISQASAMSWLIAIARNHSIDRLRARKQIFASIDDKADIPADRPTPEDRAISSAIRSKIDACPEQLDAKKAEAVRGAYLDGYAYQELADRLETPLNTIRTWLRRSLLKLRDCLEE
jgi:RNA polymerase sigma-70 factor, ECF subfamily